MAEAPPPQRRTSLASPVRSRRREEPGRGHPAGTARRPTRERPARGRRRREGPNLRPTAHEAGALPTRATTARGEDGAGAGQVSDGVIRDVAKQGLAVGPAARWRPREDPNLRVRNPALSPSSRGSVGTVGTDRTRPSRAGAGGPATGPRPRRGSGRRGRPVRPLEGLGPGPLDAPDRRLGAAHDPVPPGAGRDGPDGRGLLRGPDRDGRDRDLDEPAGLPGRPLEGPDGALPGVAGRPPSPGSSASPARSAPRCASACSRVTSSGRFARTRRTTFRRPGSGSWTTSVRSTVPRPTSARPPGSRSRARCRPSPSRRCANAATGGRGSESVPAPGRAHRVAMRPATPGAVGSGFRAPGAIRAGAKAPPRIRSCVAKRSRRPPASVARNMSMRVSKLGEIRPCGRASLRQVVDRRGLSFGEGGKSIPTKGARMLDRRPVVGSSGGAAGGRGGG